MSQVKCDYVSCFGDENDGVLELILESHNKAGKFSAVYYRSNDKKSQLSIYLRCDSDTIF